MSKQTLLAYYSLMENIAGEQNQLKLFTMKVTREY